MPVTGRANINGMKTDRRAEFSAMPHQEQIIEAERMDDRNRQRFERARAEGRCMVMLEELRFGPDDRMRSVACLRSVARMEKAQKERRAQEDDGPGRGWQRKFIDDEGNVYYDGEADRAAAAYWKAREARMAERRNRGCEAEIVADRSASIPRSRSRRPRGNSSRTRGSRRSAPSGGGGDSGDGSGESDPDGDHHPPAVGEKAEKRCESCDRPFREPGRTCARCRKAQQRDREKREKLNAEPRELRPVPTCGCSSEVGCYRDEDGRVCCLTCSRVRQLEYAA